MRALRRRLTAVALLVLAVVLVVAAVVLVGVQRRQLEDRLDDRLRARADDIELRAEALAQVGMIEQSDDDDRAAQLVTETGGVLASTTNLVGDGPIGDVPSSDEELRTVDSLPVDDDPFRVLSRRIELGTAGADGTTGAVVHVAETVDEVDESVDGLVRSLAFAVPAVLLLLAWLSWWLTGRAVRPVEVAAERQARFVSDASHELRSPLTRLRTRLEVDLAHPDGVDLRDTASAALDESRGMEHLVDDLLHLASAEGDTQAARAVPDELVDLDDVVLREARNAARPAAGTVRIDTSQVSGVPVRGDVDDLARLVRNLLDNGVRHAESTVVVGLADDDGTAVLTIDDDGPGIPVEHRASVFERFTRLDEARTRDAGGAGLGLAIVRQIAVDHGGTVDIDGSPLGGARLVVRLPSA